MPRSVHAPLAAVILLVALLLAGGAAPAEAAAPAGVPGPVGLTEGWQRLADPADRGVAAGLADGRSGTGWQDVGVPNVVDPHPDESAFPGSIAWYRTSFDAPALPAGFAWALHFEQVRRFARVWLDGREVGEHRDPYVPFELAAPGLTAGARHTLVVRVDYRRAPGTREGWWNWGGITRPVSLVPRGPVVLEHPAVLSDVSCTGPGTGCRAAILVDGTAVNDSSAVARAPTVRVTLTPPSGGRAVVAVTRPVRALAPGETAHVRFRVPVADPELWWPEHPRLYGARVTTSVDGRAVGSYAQPVGLRGVQVRDGMLQLNGRQLDLRGASVQEDFDGHGPIVTPAEADRVVARLKAIGANVTRAHYLLSPLLLDRFDRAGIMVWQQSPVYHADVFLRTAAHRREALGTVRDTIDEARTHASVITHSVANELSPTPDEVPSTKAFLDAAKVVAQQEDPTLPPSVDLLSYPNYPRAAAFAQYPLLGINSYFGWYTGKPGPHSTAKLSDFGPFLDRMRRLYPTSALVVTEFGAEASFSGPATEKETYQFQSAYLQRVLDVVAARPFVGGAIYWTLQEFAVKPDWDGGAGRDVPRDGIHRKGLIAYDGKPKPALAEASRDFHDTAPFRVVSAAEAADEPLGLPGGPMALVLGVGLLVAALLLLDAWALVGLVRLRRTGSVRAGADRTHAARERDRTARARRQAAALRP